MALAVKECVFKHIILYDKGTENINLLIALEWSQKHQPVINIHSLLVDKLNELFNVQNMY